MALKVKSTLLQDIINEELVKVLREEDDGEWIDYEARKKSSAAEAARDPAKDIDAALKFAEKSKIFKQHPEIMDYIKTGEIDDVDEGDIVKNKMSGDALASLNSVKDKHKTSIKIYDSAIRKWNRENSSAIKADKAKPLLTFSMGAGNKYLAQKYKDWSTNPATGKTLSSDELNKKWWNLPAQKKWREQMVAKDIDGADPATMDPDDDERDSSWYDFSGQTEKLMMPAISPYKEKELKASGDWEETLADREEEALGGYLGPNPSKVFGGRWKDGKMQSGWLGMTPEDAGFLEDAANMFLPNIMTDDFSDPLTYLKYIPIPGAGQAGSGVARGGIAGVKALGAGSKARKALSLVPTGGRMATKAAEKLAPAARGVKINPLTAIRNLKDASVKKVGNMFDDGVKQAKEAQKAAKAQASAAAREAKKAERELRRLNRKESAKGFLGKRPTTKQLREAEKAAKEARQAADVARKNADSAGDALKARKAGLDRYNKNPEKVTRETNQVGQHVDDALPPDPLRGGPPGRQWVRGDAARAQVKETVKLADEVKAGTTSSPQIKALQKEVAELKATIKAGADKAVTAEAKAGFIRRQLTAPKIAGGVYFGSAYAISEMEDIDFVQGLSYINRWVMEELFNMDPDDAKESWAALGQDLPRDFKGKSYEQFKASMPGADSFSDEQKEAIRRRHKRQQDPVNESYIVERVLENLRTALS